MRGRPRGIARGVAGARARPGGQACDRDARAHGAISARAVHGVYPKLGSADAHEHPEQDRRGLRAVGQGRARGPARADDASARRTRPGAAVAHAAAARAALAPLPGAFGARLGPWLARVCDTVAEYLRASAAALSTGQGPPALDDVEAALDGYAAEIAALRRQGLTRELPDDAVERIFALDFALDQLHLHLRDLARCVAEFAPTRTPAAAKVAVNAGHVQ